MTAGRIVIFVPAIHAFGGVERLILELSRFLYAAGRNHTILCFSCSIDLDAHARWPMEIRSLGPPRNSFAEAWALARYLRQSDDNIAPPLFFDLKGAFYAGLVGTRDFHLHLTDPPSLLPRDISKHAFSLRGRLVEETASASDWLKALRGEAVHRINKRGVGRARSVIAMTNGIAAEIETLYGRRATVIRPGVTSEIAARRSTSIESGTIRFLSVSRLESSKRIDWMLGALAELEKADPPLSKLTNWTLDIVGAGPEAPALSALARRLGIVGRVTFHGRVDDERLEALFAQAGLFLMPAVQGYGLPALEALARGVPVILHRESGVSEILRDSLWVKTIARGREDLASAILRMVTNIVSGSVDRSARPNLLTASDWASQLAAACGWL